MSRLGKKPIMIPEEVEVKIDGGSIFVKGPKGELKRSFGGDFEFLINENKIAVKPKILSLATKKLWGTYRAAISNMIEGTTKGFEKRLEIEGVGYRAEKKGEELVLKMGFSHPVAVKPTEGVSFEVNKNIIIIKGKDKEKVGNETERIRALRRPDPYKGKGIRFEGEVLKLKPGKKMAAAGSSA